MKLLSAKAQDGLKLLEVILSDCERADEHIWRKCKRCIAIHGVDSRFDLSMIVLQALVDEIKQ